jgi:hypothetical protein
MVTSTMPAMMRSCNFLLFMLKLLIKMGCPRKIARNERATKNALHGAGRKK